MVGRTPSSYNVHRRTAVKGGGGDEKSSSKGRRIRVQEMGLAKGDMVPLVQKNLPRDLKKNRENKT